MRHVFSRHGGSMSEAGAVAWQFDRKGYIAIEPDGVDSDQIFEYAVEAGAEDVIFGDDMIEIYTSPNDFQTVQETLEATGIEFETTELAMVPKTTLKLARDEAFKVMRVIEALEDLDDIQQVYSNLDVSDELMEQYEAV